MINGVERSGTVGNDDGLWVTIAKNGNGTVTVTGQNHNFYCIYIRISKITIATLLCKLCLINKG